MVSVFVSHSSQDSDLINSIAQIMRQYSVEPYLAEFDIPNSMALPQKIDNAIQAASAMIVIWSSNVVNKKERDVVNWEISSAFARKKPIYVFTEKGVEIPFLLSQITVYARYDPLDPQSLKNCVNRIGELSLNIKSSDDKAKGIGALLLLALGIVAIGALGDGK
jgi:hypothetical protein